MQECAGEIRALRELMEQRFMALQDQLVYRHTAHQREHAMIQEAVDKAEAAINQRLEGMNELRAQIHEERGQYLTMVTYDAKHEALIQKVDGVEDTLQGRISLLENQSSNTSGRFWALGVGLTLMVIIINVVLHFIR